MPWGDSQHDLALAVLKKNESLLTDWASMDRRSKLVHPVSSIMLQ